MRLYTLLIASVTTFVLGSIIVVSGDRSVGSARAAGGPVDFGPYLRRADGQLADPVNVIFAGEGDAAAVALRLVGLLRWTPVMGSDMAFTDHDTMRWADTQLGSEVIPGLRRHIRIAGAAKESARWGPYTLAAVHHDLDAACGHVGAGFDEERNALAERMGAAGYRVSWLWLGNDADVSHCDGTRTRGDGWAAVVELRPEGGRTPGPSPLSTPAAAPADLPAPSHVPSVAPSPTASPSPTPSPSLTPRSDPPPRPDSGTTAGGG